MLADALFINGAFTQNRKGVSLTILICLAYIFWTKAVTGPRNDTATGDVTAGLACPLLNHMTSAQRIEFYALTISTALLIYLASWLIGILFPKLRLLQSV